MVKTVVCKKFEVKQLNEQECMPACCGPVSYGYQTFFGTDLPEKCR